MEKINEVFFSERDWLQFPYSILADLTQETILGDEAELKNMSFITTKVDIVGSLSENRKIVSLGYDEKSLSEVKGLLEEIAEMNAFCAWMCEAIKAKEREILQINRCSFDEWCQSGYLVIFEIQKLHRQNERELNCIKFALKRESDRLNLESQQKYKSELEKASLQYKWMFS